MPDGELYTVFVAGAPALPLPIVATDDVAVVRGGVTYQISPTALAGFGLGAVVYVSPASGTTIIAAASQGAFQITPAAPLASLTVRMPPDPYDGQVFEVATTQDISAVTVTADTGDFIFGTQNALGALGGGGGFSFRYRTATSTWIRRY